VVAATENRTLLLTDSGKSLKVTAAAAITVPPSTDVAFPICAGITLISYTANDVSVAAGTGVTVVSRESMLKINGQYGVAMLRKIDTDVWMLSGDLKA
jgi:hypothetical protein